MDHDDEKNKNGEPVLGLTFWGGAPQRGKGTEIGKMSIGGRRRWVGAQIFVACASFFQEVLCEDAGGMGVSSASVGDFIKL